nr:hypothetical protein [Tanacetum cinerariifolium]
MASEQSSSGPALNEMTLATISSGLVQKPSSSTPYVQPSRNNWDLLFQPMFDELLNPPLSVDPQAPEGIAPIADVIPPIQAESTGSPSSTTVDQDAPSLSKSQTTPETQSSVIPQDVKEDIHDIEVAHMGNDTFEAFEILKACHYGPTGGSDDGVTTSFQWSRNSRPPMLDHSDKYMMKAQVHVSKSSAISDEQALPRRKHYCQIYQMINFTSEDNIIFELPPYSAVTPTEPIDSLSMGDEHLDTIPATELDEYIKSCVENLVPNLSESEGENKCDVPAGFTTFSNVLFDTDYDFDSSDDQSLSNEDVPKKIYSNPLFNEEIILMEIDQHSFNAESDLIDSMPNHDSSITISSNIDSLFDEFTGELTLLKSIPLGIDETDCHPEKQIRLTNDSNMEEIYLPFNPDDPMPPRIEANDYDSGRDIPFLEELLDNYSLSLPANESYHFDIPSPYRPPAKPPDGNTGTLNIKIMGDVSDQNAPIPGLTITRVSNQEKSPDLLSHQGL